METKQTQMKGLSVEQKTGFVLLLFFGILAIGLGLLQMRNTIYNPFVVRFENFSAQSLLDDTTKLQKIDTDRDTLSDYDELTFYQTSAYLPDTDSDKINDNVEIANGTDPLCPEGTLCTVQENPVDGLEVTDTIDTDVKPIDLLQNAGDSVNPNLGEGTVAPANATDINELIENPQVLRKFILSTGKISEEELAKIDDATLMELAKSIDLNKPQNTQ